MSELKGTVAEAIAATAAISALIFGICFYFFYRYVMPRQHEKDKVSSSFRREAIVRDSEEFRRGGTLKGVLVEENGLEVLYLCKLEGGYIRSCVSTVWFNPIEEEKRADIEEDKNPKLSKSFQEIQSLPYPTSTVDPGEAAKTVPPPLMPLPPQLPQAPPVTKPIPTLQERPQPSLSPPPLPPPLPSGSKRNPLAPLTSLGSVGFASSQKPPAAPRERASNSSMVDARVDKGVEGSHEVQMKMKPFHWEKINTNGDRSLVWNEIIDGSFRFDEDLIETLFGYKATARKSSEINRIQSNLGSSNSAPPQISILDPRKSQNAAIVLKSLSISRREILDALLEGRGLDIETLEKLTKISPTEEEALKILQFNGNPMKLADGETFFYHVLKAVPSAFIRINAMLFRSNYDPEILQLKQSLQTLELACKELRARGIFLKLLEAILKAGNRMNAGTARGNARAFNLSALQKLSDVKSTDGKTTLLHFVVEQVIRSEGKRCVVNRNQRLGGRNTHGTRDKEFESLLPDEERDKEYLTRGLPILGGLSTEFSNVKKAATIDYDSFMKMSPNLAVRVNEIQQLVSRCGSNEREGFAKEMKGFIEECEQELKVVREEQTRVLELVKSTTEFYQAGGNKGRRDQPFQIFGFVKDFLDTVDQVCIDITRKVQKHSLKSMESSPAPSLSTRASFMLQNLQSHFTPEKTNPSSSSSEDDF